MIIKSIIGTTCACLGVVVSFNTSAALVERIDGLAYYDDVADLTWLTDTNAAGTTMNWVDANSWAAGLDVAGVTGWRLPDTLQPDASCSNQNEGDVSFGFNCTGSEMGNMFHNVLGGSAGTPINNIHNANFDLFTNLVNNYWSATEYATYTSTAWKFSFVHGGQGNNLKGTATYKAWAVHSGDISAVPVPAAVWLFGSGLISLIGLARRKTRAQYQSYIMQFNPATVRGFIFLTVRVVPVFPCRCNRVSVS